FARLHRQYFKKPGAPPDRADRGIEFFHKEIRRVVKLELRHGCPLPVTPASDRRPLLHTATRVAVHALSVRIALTNPGGLPVASPGSPRWETPVASCLSAGFRPPACPRQWPPKS